MISIKRLWKSNKYVVIADSQLVVQIDSQGSQDTLFSIDYFYLREKIHYEKISRAFLIIEIRRLKINDSIAITLNWLRLLIDPAQKGCKWLPGDLERIYLYSHQIIPFLLSLWEVTVSRIKCLETICTAS